MSEYTPNIEYLSPSSINSFLNHYDQWYERYILGIKMSPNLYMLAGTACHEFLEAFFLSKLETTDTIKSFATRNFNLHFKTYFYDNKELLAVIDPEIMTIDELQRWMANYIRIWVEEAGRIEKNPKYNTELALRWNSPSHCEEKMQNEELKIRGIIDAVYTTDNWNKMSKNLTFTLVDYKTSSKSFKTMPTEYYLQLMIYALMKAKDKKRVDWVSVDYLKYGQKYNFRVTPQQLDATEDLIKSVWKEVKHVLTLSKEDAKVYNPTTKIIKYF